MVKSFLMALNSKVSEFEQLVPGVPLHYATMEVQARHLGIPRSSFCRQTALHYSIVWHIDRFLRSQVGNIAQIIPCRARLAQVVDGCSYDSTPLSLRPLSKQYDSKVSASSTGLATSSSSWHDMFPADKSAVSANVMQVRLEFGWLFVRNVNDQDQYLMVYGKSATHLQNLVSNRPTPMLQGLAEQSCMSVGELLAPSITRLCSIDRHPSNFVVERRILRRRRRDSINHRSVVNTCHQHKLGCVRGAMAHPFEDTITGVINITRSLHSFTYCRTFKRCLTDVIFEKAHVVVGIPDRDNLARAALYMRSFFFIQFSTICACFA